MRCAHISSMISMHQNSHMLGLRRIGFVLFVLFNISINNASAENGEGAAPFSGPALSTIKPVEQEGTWKWKGTLRGSLTVARADLARSLARSDWSFQHEVRLGHQRRRILETWQNGEQSLLVMLWEEEPGRTQFSAGTAQQSDIQNTTTTQKP